jgi:hypothetical protein
MDSGPTIERLRTAACALKSGDDRVALKAIQAAQDALDAGQTKKLTRAAATMTMLPAVAEAAEQGRIRIDHVAAFSYGLKHIGVTVIRDAEEWLLPVALSHEPAIVRQVMRELRGAVYPDSLDEAWAKGMDRQDFQVNPVPDGWHVTGFLSTVTGAKLKAVLDVLGAPRDKHDETPRRRTPRRSTRHHAHRAPGVRAAV